ncbi:MAG TPA: histidinol-phosphate transaminase, partial [Syntrophomonas sp.]|nr:histidinol-phosphate transaminase [Syntrophomonas sp.]
MLNVALDHLVPSYINNFDAYIPSKPDPELKKMFGCDTLYRLNNNENPLGTPPAAQELFQKFNPARAAIYPSGDSYYLREKLADKFSLHPDQILVGNGANEVIAFVINAFCESGDNIITADKTFATYEWIATFSGYEARLVPLKEYAFDDQAMLEQVDARSKIIFICNPNNPTGTYWNQEKLVRFLDQVDGQQIVVVDEAYCEFVEKEDFPDTLSLLEKYPNLIIFRTFSKMYGLAGLRIGYLIGNLEVVNIIRKTCVVYSVNTIAQEAALLALDDQEHVIRTRKLVAEEKAYLRQEFDRLGL